jgi:hypothetical protein
MRFSLAILVGVLTAGAAQAQTPAVSLPRNDTTLSIGWSGADYPNPNDYGTGWHSSFFSGIGVGHYWTDNAKTDVEAAWLSRVHARSYETRLIGDGRAYIQSDYRYQGAKLSLAQSYQFGRNLWVHPYMGAGADIDYLREVEDRPAQITAVYGNTGQLGTVLVPAEHERDAGIKVHPFVKAGFKMYVSDRTFFTTEWKFGFGNGLQHVLWKTGFGVDF